jgi:hypothetical protein
MSRELYLRQKSASSAAALIEAPTAADAHARFGANAMARITKAFLCHQYLN